MSEEPSISVEQLQKMKCGSRGTSFDMLMERDDMNIHSRKRLESVMQEMPGIMADLSE